GLPPHLRQDLTRHLGQQQRSTMFLVVVQRAIEPLKERRSILDFCCVYHLTSHVCSKSEHCYASTRCRHGDFGFI
ncbi:hypothetical protein NDU88_001967, partial [Pleurodeles waltl]